MLATPLVKQKPASGTVTANATLTEDYSSVGGNKVVDITSSYGFWPGETVIFDKDDPSEETRTIVDIHGIGQIEVDSVLLNAPLAGTPAECTSDDRQVMDTYLDEISPTVEYSTATLLECGIDKAKAGDRRDHAVFLFDIFALRQQGGAIVGRCQFDLKVDSVIFGSSTDQDCWFVAERVLYDWLGNGDGGLYDFSDVNWASGATVGWTTQGGDFGWTHADEAAIKQYGGGDITLPYTAGDVTIEDAPNLQDLVQRYVNRARSQPWDYWMLMGIVNDFAADTPGEDRLTMFKSSEHATAADRPKLTINWAPHAIVNRSLHQRRVSLRR